MWTEEEVVMRRRQSSACDETPHTHESGDSDDVKPSRKESSGASTTSGGVASLDVEVIVYDEDGRRSSSVSATDRPTGLPSAAATAMAAASSHLRAQTQSLADKVTRTTNFLNELKTLSSSLQEQPMKEEDEDINKDRQVFIRRTIQVTTELQDGKDIVLAICKSNLSVRQWRLLCDITGSSDNLTNDDDDDDVSDVRFGLGLTGFDLDPSVRFFGIDWERVFGRCYALSVNIKVFAEQLERTSGDLDLILVNTVLRDLSTIEADVTSHAEAVLQGRLSQSQQRLIRNEQLKNCQPVPEHIKKSSSKSVKIKSTAHRSKSSKRPKATADATAAVSKSKSFRAPSSADRQQIRYKKNRTTDLSRLTLNDELTPAPLATAGTKTDNLRRSISLRRPMNVPAASAAATSTAHPCPESNRASVDMLRVESTRLESAASDLNLEKVNVDPEDVEEQADRRRHSQGQMPHSSSKKKATKIFQNFSALFKNIR